MHKYLLLSLMGKLFILKLSFWCEILSQERPLPNIKPCKRKSALTLYYHTAEQRRRQLYLKFLQDLDIIIDVSEVTTASSHGHIQEVYCAALQTHLSKMD